MDPSVINRQCTPGKGLGTKLLKRAEAQLKGNGVEEMQLGGDPFHYFSGIPDQYKNAQKLAKKHGYTKRVDTYDLINHLDKNMTYLLIIQLYLQSLKRRKKLI